MAGIITVLLQSFGRKYGIPSADAVFDVRCLENPYWEPSLREKSGLDREVHDYIFENESSLAFARTLADLLCRQATLAQARGCETLQIAVGCTGGRHRSVAVAAFLAQELEESGIRAIVSHRDIGREGTQE